MENAVIVHDTKALDNICHNRIEEGGGVINAAAFVGPLEKAAARDERNFQADDTAAIDTVRARKVVRIADENELKPFSKTAVQIPENLQPGKSILTVKQSPAAGSHANGCHSDFPCISNPRSTSSFAQKLLSNLSGFGRTKSSARLGDKKPDDVDKHLEDETESSSSEEESSDDEEESSSESDTSETDKTLPAERKPRKKPKNRLPDGGYGWVMVACSFAMLFVADGILDTFGVIFVYLLRFFNESKSTTSWVGATFTTVPLLLGPVASALTEMYGCRCMTVLGGLIGAVGFVLSYYADSIAVLCLTVGVVAGIGWSFIYVTSTIILFRWFDKKLALAMGVASSGSGIGAFVFAPLHHIMLQNYGFKGLSLLLAGVTIHIVVAGYLIRRPYAEETERAKRTAFIAKQSKLNMKRLVAPVDDERNLAAAAALNVDKSVHSSSTGSTSLGVAGSPPTLPQQQQNALLTPVMPVPPALDEDVEACFRDERTAPSSPRSDAVFPLFGMSSPARRHSSSSLSSRRRNHSRASSHHHHHRGSRTSLLSEAMPNVGHNLVAQQAIELEQMRRNEEEQQADDSAAAPHQSDAVVTSSLPPRTVDYCCSVLELPTYIQNNLLSSDADGRLLLDSIRSPQTTKNSFRNNNDYPTRIEDIELGYGTDGERTSPNIVNTSQFVAASGGRLGPRRLLAVRNVSLTSCLPVRRSLDSLFPTNNRNDTTLPSGAARDGEIGAADNDQLRTPNSATFSPPTNDDEQHYRPEYDEADVNESENYNRFLFNRLVSRSSRTLEDDDADNVDPLLIASPSFANDLEAVATASDGDLSNAVFLRDGIGYSLHDLFDYRRRELDAATQSDMVLSSPPKSKARYRETSGENDERAMTADNNFVLTNSNEMEMMPFETNRGVSVLPENREAVVFDDEQNKETKRQLSAPAADGQLARPATTSRLTQKHLRKSSGQPVGGGGARRSHRRHTTSSSSANPTFAKQQKQNSGKTGGAKHHHHHHSGSRSLLQQQQQHHQMEEQRKALLDRATQYQLRPSVLNVIQRIQRHQRNIHSRQQQHHKTTRQSKQQRGGGGGTAATTTGKVDLAKYRPSSAATASFGSERRSGNQRGGGKSSTGFTRDGVARSRQPKQNNAVSSRRNNIGVPANSTANQTTAAQHHHPIDRRGIAFVMPNARQLASTFSMSCPDIMKEFRRLHKHHSRDGTSGVGKLKRVSKKTHQRLDDADMLKPSDAVLRSKLLDDADATPLFGHELSLTTEHPQRRAIRRLSLPHDYAASAYDEDGAVDSRAARLLNKNVKPAFSTRSLVTPVVVDEHVVPPRAAKPPMPSISAAPNTARLKIDDAVRKRTIAVVNKQSREVENGNVVAIAGAKSTAKLTPAPVVKLPPPPPARRRLVELFKYMTNLSAFKSKTFLLLIISNFINFAPLDVPLDYLVDFAVEMNITAEMQASLLLSIVGIVSMVGQVLYGWYGDRTARPVLIYAASIIACGILTCGLPFIPYLPLPYSCMVAYSVLFSFFKSACQPLFAVILVETVPEQYLTNGFGFLHLVQGIASLLGPPLAGSLIDMRLLVIGADGKNSYVLSFIFSGIAMVASGLLMIPIALSTSEFNGSESTDDDESSSSSSSSSEDDDDESSSSSSGEEDDEESTTLSASSAEANAATSKEDASLLVQNGALPIAVVQDDGIESKRLIAAQV